MNRHPLPADVNVADSLLGGESAVAQALVRPPSSATLRFDTRRWSSAEEASAFLQAQINEQCARKKWQPFTVRIHQSIPDVLYVQTRGPLPVVPVSQEVIVDVSCGSAVMRGADVYAVGVHAAESPGRAGDRVAVYVDLDGSCLRAQSKRYTGRKAFIGNGILLMGRNDLYTFSPKQLKNKGIGLLMTEPVYQSPSLGDMFEHGFFLQNLPSILVGHALDVSPGQTILDMCAAPGGKTTHIATLAGDAARFVVALDRSRPKIERLVKHLSDLNLKSVRAFVSDATSCVLSKEASLDFDLERDLPVSGQRIRALPRGTFDRILVDAPCTALGQRPVFTSTVEDGIVFHHASYQRSILHAAYALLRPGGRMVFSTCTLTTSENEDNVAGFLATFPDMHLVRCSTDTLRSSGKHVDWRQAAQGPIVGTKLEKMIGGSADGDCGVCRFDPHLPVSIVDGVDAIESIGFFFAVFVKGDGNLIASN